MCDPCLDVRHIEMILDQVKHWVNMLDAGDIDRATYTKWMDELWEGMSKMERY